MAAKESEKVPVELIVMSLLLREGELSKLALYRLSAQRSDYRVNLSRAMISTALRKLQEKGYVRCLSHDEGERPGRKSYRLTPAGEIAQDIAFEEYYSTVQGMGLLLNFKEFEKKWNSREP